MIALLRQYKLIAAGLVFALAFGAGWLVNGWRLSGDMAGQRAEHQTHLRQVAEANAAVILKQQAERADLEGRLAANDQQRYGELRHAQQEIDRLSAAVADGSRRLSVRAACPAAAGGVSTATGSGSLDDGAQRADIHEEDARRIVAITGDADACAVKLTALQEWAREVTKGD